MRYLHSLKAFPGLKIFSWYYTFKESKKMEGVHVLKLSSNISLGINPVSWLCRTNFFEIKAEEHYICITKKPATWFITVSFFHFFNSFMSLQKYFSTLNTHSSFMRRDADLKLKIRFICFNCRHVCFRTYIGHHSARKC